MLMMNFEYSPKILKIASLCDAIDAQVSDHKKDDEYKSSQGHSQSLLSQRCFARLSPDGLTHTHQLVSPVTILFHRNTIHHTFSPYHHTTRLFHRHFPLHTIDFKTRPSYHKTPFYVFRADNVSHSKRGPSFTQTDHFSKRLNFTFLDGDRSSN